MIRRSVFLTLVVVFALGSPPAGALPATEVALQPVSVSVSASTGEKPQSKVWTHAGEWWSVLPHSSGTWLRRLDGDTWTDILQLSTSTSAKCDVKAEGNVAHILVFTGTASELVSVEYAAGTNTYQPWSVRPTPASITLDASVETATIDVDSQGRMWLASDASTTINVRCSDSPYDTWSSPITLATGINTDDISVVTAIPNGTVGVMWSNQATERFGFRVHIDGADSTVWSADEVPASQSAQSVGAGMADDHLNVAVASDATLYVAVKTGYDTAGYPLVALLVRRPGGTWDDLYEVDQSGTRGIVLLNESTSTVTVVYTDGGIVYRESPTSTISFGPQITLMADGSLNNATSTKQNISDEVVILASTGSSASGVLASSSPNPEGLVGWWPMEEGGGTTLADSSGYANNGVISGSPSWVAGVEGQALHLNGTTDYALVPDSTSLDLTSAITLAAWVKPEKTGTQYLIKKAQSGTNGYELSLSSSGRVFARLNQASSANTYRVDSTQDYPTDGTTWTHLALTWDGSDMRLYVDGVLDSTVSASITLATNSLAVGIGAQSNGTNLFQGAMDDARIYDRAISAPEVAVLANVPPPTGQLVGWWKMEENGGIVLVDSSGAGNDGAISGSPTWVAGQDGLALHLNGTTDYALVPDAPGLDITDSLTLAAWIKPEKQDTQYLIKKAIQGGGDGYELSLSANGTAFARLNQTTSGNTYRVDTTVPYPIDGNTWMHLALTWDGADMRLYVNGVLDSTLAAVTTIASNALDLGIGTQSNGTNLFQGAMDDVRVYGRALSPAEIAALQGGPPGNQAPVAICQNVIAVVDSISGCLATVDTSQVDNGSYDPDTDPITMVLEPAGPYPVGVNAVELIVSDGTLADTCSATITVTCPGPPELVGWWKMEEGSGPVLADSSGNGNDANIVGAPTWECGIDRLSLVLDGANDYALAPDNLGLDITDAITLAAWVKPEKTATQYVIKKAVINGTDGYELSLSNPGNVFVRFNQLTSANDYRVNSTSLYPFDGNTWMHMAATYDGNMIRLYVNGVQEDSLAAEFTIAANSLDLGIGAQSDGATKYLGDLDEVRLYSGALSSAEILALAAAPPANTPPVAVCQNVLVTISSGPCSATVDPSQVDNGSSDPDGDPFTLTLEPAGPYTAGVTAVDLIVSDGCEADTCSATITVDCPPPNPDGLVGWWPMEEGSGPSILDASGYVNDGDLSGAPIWDTGHDGLALVLDGTNDYALVPDSPSLDVTTAITLAAWIKPSKPGTQYVLKKANISVTDGYELSLATSGKAFVRFNQNTSANTYRLDSISDYPTDGNTWMHLAATYDGTTIRIYVDGVEENSSIQSFTIAANTLPLGIGAQSDGGTKLQGAIDEARVYERALSAGEIDSLFALGELGQDPVEAKPVSGTCISTAIPCVTVPVVFTRSDTTEARGSSITFRLSPELELCGAPSSSITPGDWLDAFSATFEVTDNGDSSYTVDQTILGMPCGVSTGGVLFEVQVQAGAAAAPDDLGIITVESVIVRDCDNGPLPGDPGAAAAISIDRTPPAAIGDLTASQVKTGNLPADGTTKVMLSWTPPETGSAVQIFRKGYGNYPEYDDGPGSGSVPAAPADSADAVTNGWVVTGITQPGDTDETNAARDFWYFVAIQTDSCGNVGGVSGPSNGALNYHLGDVVPQGPFGDNEVELLDISKLGASYGTQDGQMFYVDTLDVGPTTDFSVDALPTTDDLIEFEDLMMFALNFSHVSAPGGPLPLTAGIPGLRMTTTAVEAGEMFEVELGMTSHGRVQGVSVSLLWDSAVVEPVGFEPGSWLTEQKGRSVALSPRPGTVDAAVFGSTLAGEGVLATVRFRVKKVGDPGLELGPVRARDPQNRPVDVTLEMIREPIGTVTPVVTRLGPGKPNPFRAGTSLALSLAKEGPVKIQIYGLDGRLVRTLVDAVLPAARHEISWDGRDAAGREVASGAYLIRLVTTGKTQTQRIVRIR